MTAGVSDSSAIVGCDCIAFCLNRLVFIVIKVANLSLNTDEVCNSNRAISRRPRRNKDAVEPLGKAESDVQV